MADMNKTGGGTFLEVIEGARSIPEGLDVLKERDSPAPVSSTPAKESLVTSPDPEDLDLLGNIVDCKSFSKVFVIWRPWETCPLCKMKLEKDPDSFGYTGMPECPHVQALEYKKIMDHCLSGKGAINLKECYTLKNGSRIVHLEWLERDPLSVLKHKEELERQQKESVYPPNPEAAFAKGKEPKNKQP